MKFSLVNWLAGSCFLSLHTYSSCILFNVCIFKCLKNFSVYRYYITTKTFLLLEGNSSPITNEKWTLSISYNKEVIVSNVDQRLTDITLVRFCSHGTAIHMTLPCPPFWMCDPTGSSG